MNKTILAALLVCIALSPLLAQQPSQALSLRRVIEIYIQNNLDLQTARYRVERTQAELIGARMRPNPAIAVAAENLAVTGPTPAGRLYEISTTYTQPIELGNKRVLRENFANAAVLAAEAQFEDTMRRGLAELKRLYLDALLARHTLDVATENRQTFQQLVDFTQTRFQEGAIPELDLIKVRLERMKFDSTVKQAELGLRQATIRLLEKLAITDSSNPAIEGELNFSLVDLDLNALRQFALNERSDVRAAMADVTAANQRVALERGRAKPDISPFAGYKRVGSDNTLLFGVTIPLKTRDRNEAEIARAQTDVRTAEVRLRLARNHVLSEVDAAYAAFQSARELVEIFQKELLGQADESRSITLAAYEEGGTELLPVLEAQRTRSDVRQQYFKTLFDYQASIVALELATGREIQR